MSYSELCQQAALNWIKSLKSECVTLEKLVNDIDSESQETISAQFILIKKIIGSIESEIGEYEEEEE